MIIFFGTYFFFFLFCVYSLQCGIHAILVIYVAGMYKVNFLLRANMNFVLHILLKAFVGISTSKGKTPFWFAIHPQPQYHEATYPIPTDFNYHTIIIMA